MSATQIEYDDVDELNATLRGRVVTSVEHVKKEILRESDSTLKRGNYSTLLLTLDNGVVLVFQETYRCDCGNGSFSLDVAEGVHRLVGATIMNVSVAHEVSKDKISGHLELFLYTGWRGEEVKLFTSDGSDDSGNYGWGYTIHVLPASL